MVIFYLILLIQDLNLEIGMDNESINMLLCEHEIKEDDIEK